MTAKAITIQGVPDSVSRAKVQEFLTDLGIDPGQVCGLVFHAMGVEIEVYAEDRRGRFTHDGKNAATHRVTIPILDKEEPSA